MCYIKIYKNFLSFSLPFFYTYANRDNYSTKKRTNQIKKIAFFEFAYYQSKSKMFC